MIRRAAAGLALAAAALPLHAQDSATATPIAITNVTVVDVRRGATHRGMTVSVAGDLHAVVLRGRLIDGARRRRMLEDLVQRAATQ